MGRAMLIIVSGFMVALGYIGMGNMQQGKTIIDRNVGYANFVTAKNTAHMAIQMAMQKMNEDSTWAETHGASSPWSGEIEGRSFSLHAEYIHNSTDYWAPDTVRLYSSSEHPELDEPVEIVSVYEINSLDFVPEFKSPLTIATKNFSYSAGGSSAINGYDQSGSGCTDKPGITVMDETSEFRVESHTSNDLKGDPPIKTDSTISYQPTDQLIERLENLAYSQYISGNYKGSMGSKENPGVFFVEDQAKLTGGISEGYGILVVRSGGNMSYEDEEGAELDIAGNFKFNGLVIFENAYNFDGKGTPTISGSVLVGHTEDYSKQIDIDISGNLTLQYDCTAKYYAMKAAALAIKQKKYKHIISFE